MADKPKHGGPRPGAGRPPGRSDKIAVQVRRSRAAVAWLDAQQGTRSTAIERLIAAVLERVTPEE